MKQTCYAYLRAAFDALPDGPAATHAERTLLRSEFLKETHALAGYLSGLGVAPGAVVAVLLPTQLEAFTAFYAINRLGAVADFVHPLAAPCDVAAALAIPETKAVIAAASMELQLAETVRASGLPCIVCGAGDTPLPAGAVSYEVCVRAGRAMDAPAADDPDAPAVLLHGGGTTGESRAVLLSSANLNAVADKLACYDTPDRAPGEAALTALPLFHAFGLAVALHYPLTHGYRCVALPRFSGEAANALLRQYRPAFLVGVPELFRKMTEAPRFGGAHLQALRLVFSGGDTLPAALADAFDRAVRAHGGKARLQCGYGLTEVSSVCTVNAGDDARPQSVGRPLPGITIEIRDEKQRRLPPGEVGEIVISGDTVMLGYYQGDLSARDCGVAVDADGRRLIYSGDLGRLDADGYLYFAGRKKRVILQSGYTVFPAEIEAAALQLPFVAQACAVEGRQDSRACIRLFVTLSTPTPQAQAQILAHCRAQLARYAQPRSVEILSAMPRTALGKIDYRQLADRS
ncbi:MAG: acyl--CoA ligase [Clostridia bacterium]|nr:acyl--CoA ligase [Clostridia bacterium]